MTRIDRSSTRDVRYWRALAWGWAIAVLGLSVAPSPESPVPSIPGADKIVHAAMYAVLMFAFTRAYADRTVAALGFSLLCYGGALEGLQHALPVRTGSLGDGVANGIGIALAVAFFRPPPGAADRHTS